MINRFLRILFASLLATAVFTFSSIAYAEPLEVSLDAADSSGSVNIKLTNSGAVPLSILRWDTPFESTLSSDVFKVERPTKKWPLRESAEYVGREVKRASPASEHYLLLQPGASVSTQVVLNKYYKIKNNGTYGVKYSGDFRYAEAAIPSDLDSVARKVDFVNYLAVVKVESANVMINLGPKQQDTLRPTARVKPPIYENCSVEQQSGIGAAAVVAEQMVTTATADLNSLSNDEKDTSPRYNTWFGSYTETRFNQVLTQYQDLGEALADETIRYDCGCDESGVYAYVYPSDPYNIFLCPAFDSANIDGTDSRAGTIIHELSHFTILGGTDDHVYGQLGAQALANSDPNRAVGNADSMEYFAENTPAIPIRNDVVQPDPQPNTQLILDTPVSGELAQGDTMTYEVVDASNISLESLSGDADLTIYSDGSFSAEICSSSNSSSTDGCEIFQSGRIYVRVFGFSASMFTLEATGGAPTAEPEPEVLILALDSSVTGSLAESDRAIYEIDGADLIELESLSGDADLYVFNSLEFVNSNLICASVLTPSDSTTDSCNVPSDVDRVYLQIVGFTASEFSLLASETLVGVPVDPIVVPDPIDTPDPIITPDPVDPSDTVDGYVFSRTDKSEFRWVVGMDNIWITSDCAVALGGATQSGTWSDLNAIAPGFDQAADPCNDLTPPDNGVPPVVVDGYVFSRTDKSEFRWVSGMNNIWITSDCAVSLGGATQSGTWSDLNAIAPGFDQAADPCSELTPPDTGTPPVVVDGYVFSRTDKSEFRWVSGTNNIWITSECAASLGGATQSGTWSDLNDVAPGFDQAEDPCTGIPPNDGGIDLPSDGFVFARDDKNEYRWVVGSNNIWINEPCAISLGGASLAGSWSDLNALAPGFDQAENPCL